MIGLAFGGVLGAVWLVLVVLSGKRISLCFAISGCRGGGRTHRRRVFLLSANAVVMDNPLYPAGYDLPGGNVPGTCGCISRPGNGAKRTRFLRLTGASFSWDRGENLAGRFRAGRFQGVVLAAMMSIVSLLNDRRAALAGFTALIWVGLGLTIFWYVIPYHFSRFLFAIIAVAVVAGFWALHRGADLVWRAARAAILSSVGVADCPTEPRQHPTGSRYSGHARSIGPPGWL